MKSTSSKPDPRAALESVLADRATLFQNVAALRQIVAEAKAPLLIRAQCAGPQGSAFWNPRGFVQNIAPNISNELVAAIVALEFLEGTPEFLEAKAEIEPLLAAVAALEKAEAIAVQNAADAERDRREMVDAAKAQAFAKVEAQFAVA
jgi:hypothetical protein